LGVKGLLDKEKEKKMKKTLVEVNVGFEIKVDLECETPKEKFVSFNNLVQMASKGAQIEEIKVKEVLEVFLLQSQSLGRNAKISRK
jgi:hypothetical protein